MRSITALTLILTLTTAAFAREDWTQFRGPGASGAVEDNPALPEVWSVTRNLTWNNRGPRPWMVLPRGVWRQSFSHLGCFDGKCRGAQERALLWR